MIRKWFPLWLAAMLTVLAACSNNEVTVDGNITNLGNTNLRVAYCVGADRVADKIVGCQADHFQFKCQVDELSLIVIYNVQGGIVARFVADGGDDITITGDKNKPREFKITGNKINEQWCQFMSDHKVEYQASDPAKLDEAIVKWVNENPRDITSTLLLLNDYSNRDGQLDKLLGTLHDDAKPIALVDSYETLQLSQADALRATLKPMKLFSASGGINPLSVGGAGQSLIIFWDNHSASQRRKIIATLENANEQKQSVQLADVYLESDTSGWRSTWKNETFTMDHYWAPQGPMHSDLLSINIQSTPTIIVADSTGRQLYRGSDPRQALKKLK